jgi:hypothetical protein
MKFGFHGSCGFYWQNLVTITLSPQEGICCVELFARYCIKASFWYTEPDIYLIEKYQGY